MFPALAGITFIDGASAKASVDNNVTRIANVVILESMVLLLLFCFCCCKDGGCKRFSFCKAGDSGSDVRIGDVMK